MKEELDMKLQRGDIEDSRTCQYDLLITLTSHHCSVSCRSTDL